MSEMRGFTYDEWRLVAQLPIEIAASASIADAQEGSGSTREIMAAINTFLTGAMLLRHNELVHAIFEDYKMDGQGEAELLKLCQDPPIGLIDRTIEHSRAATTLLSTRSNQDEATEYKIWLSTMAADIVLASRAGGFLGFGGTRVTEGEHSFLTILNSALGVEVHEV